jgi:hypothetical protein
MTKTPDQNAPSPPPASEVELRTAEDARVQVFFGEATETGCRIYAESERPSEASAVLSGFVRGPFCAYAHTVPTNHPFRRAPGQTAGRAEAWVADPCFWTPAMPYLYQYTIERELAGHREKICGWIGIRRLGREGSNLRLDGKRWVLRAAQAERLELADLPAWHDASMAAIVRRPGAVPLDSASRTGVLLVVEISTLVDVEQELRRLRDEAAVGMVILGREAPVDPRSFARNLLFAQRFRPGEPIRPDDWADVALCEMEPGKPWTESVSGRRVPLVALRSGGQGLLPEDGRALCDLLQRDLAEGPTSWAGFVV